MPLQTLKNDRKNTKIPRNGPSVALENSQKGMEKPFLSKKWVFSSIEMAVCAI
jgi:hypothetical protein